MVGVCATLEALEALMQRAVKGGSYTVDVALKYYNQWLIQSVGLYPESVWQALWKRNGRQVVPHHWPMARTIPLYLAMMAASAPHVFDDKLFKVREAKAAGVRIRTVKPVLKWSGGTVKPGFNVSARRNGVDKPRWPEDLMAEIVD
jgi:hypothetical protein